MNALTDAARAADDDTRDDITRDDDTNTVEARARRIGWVPKEEFRGDPERWAPAADFLERGERTLPILLERNRKIDDKLGRVEKDNKALRDQLAAMDGTLKEARDTFVEFRERTANVEQRAYARARAEILAEREAAVASADPAAFRAADAKLAELDAGAPKPAAAKKPEDDDVDRRDQRREPERRADQQDAPQISDVARSWIAENKWFATDARASAKATALHGANLAAGMDEAESLEDVRASIEALRPDLFENPRRQAPGSVNPPSNPGRKQRNAGRTFDDLPQESKDAYAKFHKQDPKFTKEDYLRDYIWD